MSVKRIHGQDTRFGALYVLASDYDRDIQACGDAMALAEKAMTDADQAIDMLTAERDAIAADNKCLREALSTAKYRIEQGRVWNGMGWTLTGLHPLGQQKALDAIDAALSSGKEAGDGPAA